MAIIDFFDRGWRVNPGGIAYVQDDRTFTFDEIGSLSCRVANALLAADLPAGTKGAIWAGNDVLAWSCTLGLWRANMCWIPIGARNAPADNAQQLDSFDCHILFFQSRFAEVIAGLRPKLPKVQHWVCIDGEVDAAVMPDAVSLHAWIASQPSSKPDVPCELDDVVMLSPTGGTTGEPKGVMNTHRSVQTFCAHFMMSCPYDAAEQIVNLAAAPMTHTAGVLSLPATARGGTVVVLTAPEPRLLLDTIRAHRVTETFLPPTVIYRLLDTAAGSDQGDFASLRYFLYGAAPMSVTRLKEAIEVFGPCMMGGYGQTEAPASISFLRPSEHLTPDGLASDQRLGSVGRPNPLVRVEIMDNTNQMLTAGETGEICVRGDLVMKGYYNAPDKTAETIVDGWLHTGDIGHLDEAGYLHITDRKKDMIISGGFNVFPSEVEQVIWAHPAVADCAVIGVPDPEWGEAVKAVIEVREGHEVSPQEIIALCRGRLGSVKSPKSVDVVASLPRSPIGKVLKKDLRATYWTDAGRTI